MLETHAVDGSALVKKSAGIKDSASIQLIEGSNREADSSRPSTSGQKTLWCTCCKRHSHTRETCWKLNGWPSNVNRNFSDRGANEGGQAHVASIHSSCEGNPQNSISELNKEDIERLKNFLGSLEKPTTAGTCLLAFSGISSSSCITNVSNKISPNAWVINSGATNHMTRSSKKFPCSSHRKITIARWVHYHRCRIGRCFY